MTSLSRKVAASSASTKPGTPASQRSISLAKKRRAGKDDAPKVVLERVLGLTCHSANSLAVSDSCIAYPAGNVAVLLGLSKKNKHLYIHNKKAISCLSLSPAGSHLAVGECGHEPSVTVWELGGNEEPHPLTHLKGHEYGVQCVAFYPGQKYLVSIGYMHDRQVIVWNWKTGTQLVQGKFGQSVNAMAISQDHSSKLGNSYFVTGHHRRLQYWYFDAPKEANKRPSSVLLKSRSAVLGDLQSQTFVGVACGRGVLAEKTYAITKSGRLCVFDNKRTLDKFTEVKVSPAVCLTLNDSYLFCGGCDGVIRVFDPFSLDYIITLPRPHPLGVDLSASASPSEKNEGVVYPEAIAMVINNNKLSVVYVDHSLYIWDVGSLKQVGKLQSFLYHNACVWDIATYPGVEEDSSPLLPDSAFITCSSDGTLRFWCLDQAMSQWNPRNLYSKELLRIVYMSGCDKEVLKDRSTLPGDASAVADATRGLRCIATRPDGKHVAVGDREGNVRVYDLEFMDKVYEEVAHDSEVLCLSFSKEVQDTHYMASASRDRMVHVFSSRASRSGYEPIQSVPDHSASVTAISFTTNKEQELQLLSCGADKSVLYHVLDKSGTTFHRANHVVSKTAIYDMAVDAEEKSFFISGPDRLLRVYSVSGGKKLNMIKVTTGDEGGLLKVTLDPSGLYAATSCADKTILLLDVTTGECVSKLSGHSEVVTQLKFSRDGRHLYSVSGDSCIFVWKLPRAVVQTIQEGLSGKGYRPLLLSTSPVLLPQPTVSQECPLPPGVLSCMDMSKPLEQLAKEKQERQDVERQDVERQDVGRQDVGRQDVGSKLIEQQPGTDEVQSVPDPTDQADFDFRLSMLPEWAQKAALSRPSVAHMAEKVTTKRKDSGPVAGGRWEERAVTVETRFAMDERQESDQEDEEDEEVRRRTRVLSETSTARATSTIQAVGQKTDCYMGVVEADDVPLQNSAVGENPPRIFLDDSDDEVGVVYASSCSLDVDPSVFTVTTPTKADQPESPVEEVDIGEVDVAVEDDLDKGGKVGEFSQREFLSLLTNYPNFDSCSEWLHPHSASLGNARLSISAKFFKRHQEQFLVDKASSPLLERESEEEESPLTRDMLHQLTSPPPRESGSPLPAVRKELEFTETSPVIAVTPPRNTKHEEDDDTQVKEATRTGEDIKLTEEESMMAKEDRRLTRRRTEGDNRPTEVMEPPAKRTREFDDAVSQTKKRLEELGYDIPNKERRKRRKESDEDLPSFGKKSMEKKNGGSPIRVSAITRDKDLRTNKEQPKSGNLAGAPMLAGKMSAVLENLQSNFKTLALLHEEAVKAGAGQVVEAITAGIGSHRAAVVGWEQTEGGRSVEGGGRKRSATSPPDSSNRERRKRLAGDGGGKALKSTGEGQDGDVIRTELQVGSKDSCEVVRSKVIVRSSDSEDTPKKELSSDSEEGGNGNKSIGGDFAGDKVQEASCSTGDRSHTSCAATNSNESEPITLTGKQIQEAKDLMQKLMGYFS